MVGMHSLRDVMPGIRIQEPAPVGATTDWMGRSGATARALVAPTSTAQVSGFLRWAHTHHVPVVVQGGNTGLVGGCLPTAADQVILNLCGLRDLDVDPVAGEVTAGAGVTVAEVQTAAAAAGRQYGVDLGSRDSATIGGTIATNAGGLRVIAFGDTRAQLRGLEWVRADGTVIDDLAAFPKDNTGLPLTQLLCGSEGTVGVVTKARLRLHRPFPATTLAVLAVADLAEAWTITGLLKSEGARLMAAEIVDAGGLNRLAAAQQRRVPVELESGYALFLETTGDDPAIWRSLPDDRDIAIGEDAATARGLWWFREEQSAFWTSAGPVHKFDVSVPRRDPDGVVAAVRAAVSGVAGVTDFGVFGHINEGNLHIQVIAPKEVADVLADRALGAVVAAGGSISAEHGVGRDKAHLLGLRRSTAELDTMRMVKHALDPNGILNSGVLFADQ